MRVRDSLDMALRSSKERGLSCAALCNAVDLKHWQIAIRVNAIVRLMQFA